MVLPYNMIIPSHDHPRLIFTLAKIWHQVRCDWAGAFLFLRKLIYPFANLVKGIIVPYTPTEEPRSLQSNNATTSPSR